MQLPTYFQGILFDLDGTLVDSMPYHIAAWQHAADLFEFPCDCEWINSLGGMPSREIIRLIEQQQQRTLDIKAVCAAKAKHYQQNILAIKPFTAMFELVREQSGKRPMAIATGSPCANAKKILDNTGLSHYFHAIIGADDVEHHKPAPDTYLLAAQHIGVKAKHCLVFEDTPLGQQAAQNAGMHCVIVENGKPNFSTLASFTQSDE